MRNVRAHFGEAAVASNVLNHMIEFRKPDPVESVELVVRAAAAASAQLVTTLPGSSCQASGSAQSLYYGDSSIANRRGQTRSAVYLLVRTNQADGAQRIVVHVRDRHTKQDITCIARARTVTGGDGWSQTKSTSGRGFQQLLFGPAGDSAPDFGPYSVVCSLPPMEP